MPEAVILEFRDTDPSLYDNVNAILGLDPLTGEGDWPEGMISHAAADHADGNGITVFEIWASQADHQAFMASRLGPALHQAGAPQPARVEWMTVHGTHVS